MNFLKGLLLTILSLLLFLSLSVFGLVFVLNSTLLNPDFAVRQVEKLDISAIAGDLLAEHLAENLQEEARFLEGAISEGIAAVISTQEPWMKEQAGAAIHAGYGYLLGKSGSLSVVISLEPLKESLRDSLRQSLKDHIILDFSNLPDDQVKAFIGQHYEEIIAQIPGQYLQTGISLLPDELVKQFLKDNYRELLGYLPEEYLQEMLEPVVEAQLDLYFDQYYGEFARQIPDEFIFDESYLPPEVMEQMVLVRQYVSYFQLGYWLLLGFMALLVLAIILVHRNVKGPTRELGITLLIYGVLEFAGVFLARSYMPASLPLPSGMPAALEAWLLGLSADLLAPMQTFSIGVLVAGVVLLIVSFVYPRREAEED
ncbi:hypothetical protein ACFLXF_00420 [Chloroflexota bacterium]